MSTLVKSMRLGNKVAIITGAGAGIGRESVLLFAAAGCKVVATDVKEGDLSATVAAAKKEGLSGIETFVGDVSKAADCEAMVKFAEAKFGKLNVLFNNAGIMMGD